MASLRIDRLLARRLRPAFARLDRSPLARALLALLLVPIATAVAAWLRSGGLAAETAGRFALGLLGPVLLGRGLRLAVERRVGSVGFAPLRDPVLDGVVGAAACAVAVLLLSSVLGLGLGVQAPIVPTPAFALAVPLVPLAALGLALWLCAGRAAGRGIPRVAEVVRLAAALAAFAWLTGDHLVALRGYSSDPDQHIAWLSQLRAFGFVSDVYLHTDAPITYPRGFHALLYGLGGLSGLPASTLVALAPPFASFVAVWLALRAGRALVGGAGRGWREAALEGLRLLSPGAAFHSAQFSIWNVYEGTARLAAGLLHAPLVLVLLAGCGARAGPRPGDATSSRLRFAPLPFAVLVSSALVLLLNPAHLPLHGLLGLAALLVHGWRARREPWLGVGGGVGLAAGVAVALATLAADPYARARVLGMDERRGGALARVEAEFDAALDGETCLRAGCIADAVLSARTAAWTVLPLRTLFEGPFRVAASPRFDTSRVPLLRVPANFPDPTGMGMAPLHGAARWLLAPLPLLLVALPRLRRQRVLLAGAALLLAVCSLDAALRAGLRELVDPADAALRLLPDYANRASAVLFTQSLWPLLVAGALFACDPPSARGLRLAALGVGIVALAALWASAERDVRERQRRLPGGGPSATDLLDLRALEREHMPPGAHHLVSSHVAESNRERWLVPIDPSVPLYLQGRRPVLFLYHLSSGAHVTAADLGDTCASLRATAGPPALLRDHDARWAAVLAAEPARARRVLAARTFCGIPFPRAFPRARLVEQRGRVALFRLW